MTLADVLAVLTLLVGVPLNLYVRLKLRRLWLDSKPRNKVIHERETVSRALLLLAIVFGLVFLNNDLDVPILSGEATKIITRLVLDIVVIVPASYWLWIYRRA